jgi:acyl-CoA synthetase (AMP-forming)/AMP-acid ligase II
MDVTNLMRRAATFNAGREAIAHGDRRLTFAQAWQRGCRLANRLIALGLRPGDRLGVLEGNSVEAADLFAGAAIANVVKVPLYPRNARAAHLHMLDHTGCRALVVSADLAQDVAGFTDELAHLEHVVVRDDGYEAWLAEAPATDPMVPTSPEDWFIIRHTGGTTGPSKGVGYTHKAWLDAGRDWFYLFPPVEPGDKCMHVGPISHGSGYQFLPVWLAGGSNVLVDHFEPEVVLDLMEREPIAYAFMVPTMVNALVRHPAAAGRDWSRLKCILIGGAPIADDTALAAHDVFGDRLWQGYGQTEALPVCVMGPRQWFTEVEGSEPLRAAGLPLPFADLAILDPASHEPVEAGGEGEIAIRCDGQMRGFWDNPAATAERMHDGWVLTGDIGRIDGNGYLYVVDRKDDMIISGGFNIWPAELENVLTDHPAVLEAAVFGVPSDRWGESPMAVVTVDGSTSVTEEELVELCALRLGSYKKPVGVVLSSEPLPKSPVGKILRTTLREPYWEGHARRVSGS